MRNLSAKLYRPGRLHATATAWLVSDDYVLTAYHCVLDDAGRPYAEDQRFQLEFDAGETVQAVLEEYHQGIDAAILHLLDHAIPTAGKIAFDFLPSREVWATLADSKKRWTGWGYPQGRPEGLLIEGTIALPDAPYEGDTAIQLNCDQGGASGEPLEGMSGAAVVRGQGLAGIIRSAPPGLAQQVIYATPIRRIADELKIMRAILATHVQRELDSIDHTSDASSAMAWQTAGSMNVAAEGITHRSNLVCKSTRLYGRAEQIVDIRARIGEGARLVTLHGQDGCGKTRLAYEVGKAFLDRYDGVFMADLMACDDGASMLTEIANTLGVREAHDNLLEESLTVVIGERQVLLILDGAERLAESRELLRNLLEQCANLHLLVIRRQPLRWDGQEEYAALVKPLPLRLDGLHGADLIAGYGNSFVLQIFQEQAKRAHAAFRLDITNVDLVAALCRPTGGIPLAIELVAGHVGAVFAVSSDVYDAIRRLRAFEDALGTIERMPLETRLEAIVKLVSDALDTDTRSLFMRLSAFAGGMTVETAEYVGFDLGPREEIANKLELLANRGLLWQGRGIKGKPYFRLQPAVLDYCSKELAAKSSEAELTVRRQVAYYAQLAAKAERRLTLLSSDELIDWFELLEFEYVNIRNVLARTDSDPGNAEQVDVGLGIVGNLFWFWNLRGSLVEGIRWSTRLLAKSGSETRNHAAARYCSGGLYYLRGDFLKAREELTISERLWKTYGDQRRLGFTLVLLGAVALHQDEPHIAIKKETDARTLFECLDDRAGFALALNDLANVMMEVDRTEAEQHYMDALEIWQDLRNYWGVGLSISNLGRLACSERRYTEANSQLLRALKIQSTNRYQWGYAESLKFMGYTLLGAGDLQGAAKEFRDSFIAHQRLGRKHLVADCLDGLGKVAIRLQRPLITAYLFGAADRIRTGAAQSLSPFQRAELRNSRTQALVLVADPREFDQEFDAGAQATFPEVSRKAVNYAEQMMAAPSATPSATGTRRNTDTSPAPP